MNFLLPSARHRAKQSVKIPGELHPESGHLTKAILAGRDLRDASWGRRGKPIAARDADEEKEADLEQTTLAGQINVEATANKTVEGEKPSTKRKRVA